MKAYRHSWIGELATFFETAQLQDVQVQSVDPPISRAYLYMNVSMLAYEEFIDRYAGTQRATREEIEDLRARLAKAGAEISQGAAWSVPRVIAVGRKPS